jgi:hypothetical protein
VFLAGHDSNQGVRPEKARALEFVTSAGRFTLVVLIKTEQL